MELSVSALQQMVDYVEPEFCLLGIELREVYVLDVFADIEMGERVLP